LADLSFTNLIRRRPRADPVQKHVPGDRTTQKGIDSSRPVTEAWIERSEIRGRTCRSDAAPGFCRAQPGLQNIKEAKRRQTRILPFRIIRMRSRAESAARSPVGVPPRRLRQRANAAAQLQNALPGRRFRRALSAVLCPSPATKSQTGHRAGRAFSRSRPGVEVTSRRPREPLSLHQPVSPDDVLDVSEIL
jgi:hypothetical protein